MFLLDLIAALDTLTAGDAPGAELSAAERQARRDKARRLAMMQRPAFGLAAGPA